MQALVPRQSAVSVGQLRQVPLVQVWYCVQGSPQAPQWSLSVRRSLSQPVATWLSQLPVLGGQTR